MNTAYSVGKISSDSPPSLRRGEELEAGAIVISQDLLNTAQLSFSYPEGPHSQPLPRRGEGEVYELRTYLTL